MSGMSPTDLPASIQTAMALVLIAWIGVLIGFAWYLRRKHGAERRSAERKSLRGHRPSNKPRRRK